MKQQNPTAQGHFPSKRMRRNRTRPWLRDMLAEHHLNANDLIWPVFVIEGENQEEPVESLPGTARYSVDRLVEQVKHARDLGIQAVAIFPCVEAEKRTPDGTESYNPDNLICRTLQAVKKEVPEIGIIADVALDPYTSHGHDGIVEDGKILNDETVEILTKQATVQAAAGADIIAPSDMMDGRVKAIRGALDQAKHQDTAIMSYAAKYASAFYGPFRDAVKSGERLQGDKKTYQMNPANAEEALHEVALDIQEGADMVMVKPGLPYLDIIKAVKDEFHIPTFAYHVSGEYAQLKAASAQGWLDYETCLMESLLSFKRAGCSGILTYGALDAAKILASQ